MSELRRVVTNHVREIKRKRAILAAAAPDLYEALELYVNAYSMGFPSPNILVESGQRALAKARGETE